MYYLFAESDRGEALVGWAWGYETFERARAKAYEIIFKSHGPDRYPMERVRIQHNVDGRPLSMTWVTFEDAAWELYGKQMVDDLLDQTIGAQE